MEMAHQQQQHHSSSSASSTDHVLVVSKEEVHRLLAMNDCINLLEEGIGFSLFVVLHLLSVVLCDEEALFDERWFITKTIKKHFRSSLRIKFNCLSVL